MKLTQLRQIIREELSKTTIDRMLNEGMTEDDLSIGGMYDLYFKEKPSWKWFRGVKLSEITPTELIFRWEGKNGGWDITVDKKEFLENNYIIPSAKNQNPE